MTRATVSQGEFSSSSTRALRVSPFSAVFFVFLSRCLLLLSGGAGVQPVVFFHVSRALEGLVSIACTKRRSVAEADVPSIKVDRPSCV